MNKILIAFFILFAASTSYSDQNDDFNYLMNERVSLFDFGIYRLNGRLSKIKQEKTFTLKMVDGDTKVNLNNNTLTIDLIFSYTPTEGEKDYMPDLFCAVSLEQFKERFSNFHENSDTGVKAALNTVFKHVGYQSNDRPSSVVESLYNSTIVKATLYDFKNQKKSKPEASCSKRIMDIKTTSDYKEKKEISKEDVNKAIGSAAFSAMTLDTFNSKCYSNGYTTNNYLNGVKKIAKSRWSIDYISMASKIENLHGRNFEQEAQNLVNHALKKFSGCNTEKMKVWLDQAHEIHDQNMRALHSA
ncbi:hypothetical protein M3P05_20140 [Sansalvadorimonas sp. 2012CJ34-2]|uniref:Uncharacterized protein n=1 Tax=Parendozoicomonas callyspongiae TaxID=2942213 RepID=A0ABT0PLH6_9GAMM|nr:hypothetical protein [Sansalvadorimonas sp. 2012CJ34-2]MCL6272235.1 hypothetical protein [Sansalvadorimonas sp. 2012CJ34-2]